MLVVIRAFVQSRLLIFPQELTDQIIEELQDDIVALKSCSLVCRSWLFSSRGHLFRKLIFTRNNAAQLSTFITGPPRSAIPPYVRRIEFHGAEFLFGPESHFLGHFSSKVTHLHFRDIVFGSLLALLDVVCKFPVLQSLGLVNVKWAIPDPLDQKKIQRRALPLSMVHMQLYHIPFRSFMIWLMSHAKFPTVPSLEIGPLEEPDIPYTGSYMASIGSNLQYLSFSFGFGENGHICSYELLRKMDQEKPEPDSSSISPIAYHYWKVFGISACDRLACFTSLRTLRIDGFLDSSAIHQSTALFWAPRLLASIRSYNIRSIILGLKLSRAGELDAYNVNWEFLDVTLMSDAYANLRSVEFEVDGRVNIDGVAGLLEARLPKVASRGLLRFLKPV
ncbi:hypothetical protein GALMADRAFT_151529 [Galerina marginata CBS 339.88]|uniref:F-box domain-containing protein n=1 Tax=Galerina marginata (strain CBS 339.88) TaxID=685588 RepID=A0A067TGX5_GALM3|nr:hypothetical protein GALMADRAFT_151529 [Galerina marginata CBS 339.88]